MSKHTREFQLDLDTREDGQRVIRASLSSETPVTRYDYREVLSHDPAAVDLSRAPLPLIIAHDRAEPPVGVVEQLRVEGRRLVGQLRFGASARARELWEDVREGVLRSLSVGYSIDDSKRDGDTVTATRWTPFEVSLVSVPADASVGIGRSYQQMTDTTTDTTTDTAPSAEQGRRFEALERARRDGIKALCANFRDKPGIDALEASMLDDLRCDEAQARRELLTFLGEHAPVATPLAAAVPGMTGGSYADRLGIPKKEQREFSVVALINRMSDPKSTAGGYELEVSQALENDGRKARHGGALIPIDLPMHERALTVGGAGALVGTEHMWDRFIDVIRERSVVLQAGATQMMGLVQNVSIPRKTAPAAVAWHSLDGTEQITPTDPTFDAVTLQPNQLAGITVYSHLMLRQGLPAVEAMVRSDLAGTVAAGIDKALLNGSGTGSEPAGISQTAGTKNTHTAAAPTYAQIIDLRQAVFTAGADVFGGLAYVAHPGLLTQLEGTQKFASEGESISENALSDGQFAINGVPGYYSANQALNGITFGAWSEALVGWWGPAVELVTDATYDFARASQAVRIIADIDTDVRHAGSFAISTPV